MKLPSRVPRLFKCVLLIVFLFTLPVAAFADAIPMAVSVNGAADWTSGSHSTISVDATDGSRTLANNLLPTISDLAVSAHGEYFFRIERYGADNVTKFQFGNPDTPIWQVSTKESGEEGLQSDSANPFAMVFASAEKAYLIRYGANTAWVVDPSVDYAHRDQFKIGELDLSVYADMDGYPEMCGGVVVGDKLFVVMQRLQDCCPAEGVFSYVAVFDTATNEEIDTGKGVDDGLKGIPLPIYNAGFPEAGAIQYLAETGKIYISGPASIGFCSSGIGGKGGVVAVDPGTYEADLVLDGTTDPESFQNDNVFGVAMASATKGYFVSNPNAYAITGSANVFRSFNPQTGVVDDVPVNAYLDGKDIGGLKIGPQGKLWICNSSDAELVILDPSDDSIEETLTVGLLPKQLAFGQVENASPNQPILVMPADDAEDVSLTPDLEIGAFDDPDGNLHSSTRFQVSRNVNFTDLVFDREATVQLTDLALPAGILTTDDDGLSYYWRAKVADDQGAASAFAEANRFSVIALEDTDDPDGDGVPDDQAVDVDDNLILDDNLDLAAGDIVTVETESGDQIAMAVDGDNVTSVDGLRAIASGEIADDDGKPHDMSLGLLAFRITVDNLGDTAEVTVYLSEAAPEEAEWYRYDAATGWENYEDHVTWAADRKSLMVEFKDGGFGDDDGIENGIIVDPSGFGIPKSSDGSSGGGCFIGAAKDFASVQGIAVVLALLGLGVVAVFSRGRLER